MAGQQHVSLPPYAYVPGHWPHPLRDPTGHSYGHEPWPRQPLSLSAWRRCRPFVAAITLFDGGYYWEAHEAWEVPYRLASPSSDERAVCQGLILLAAAGVKARQGLPRQVVRFGERARRLFVGARQRQPGSWDGLCPAALERLSAYVAREGWGLVADPQRPVEVVFPQRLLEHG